jgi:hypothetical protein
MDHAARVPFLLTTTAPGRLPPGFSSWWEWNHTAPERWARFWRSLVDAGFVDDGTPYARVWELHRERDGLGRPLHAHAVVLGWNFGALAIVRRLASAAGLGERVEVKAVGSKSGVTRYLAGYLTKSHEYLGRRRVVTYSRAWPTAPERQEWADHRRMVAALDPADAVLSVGESWWSWAEWQERRGWGRLVFDSRASLALVRAPRADYPPGAFFEVPGGVEDG